ncbi:PREDICTED: uncharacterized protein LOC107329706 isoform X4 [Acropora digitifera]|uniref:uncharacterized protein LOC107329706 isoform X4 n=1 Tax=Acropora digitifera TaxID=70779 RepID=UPI00077A23E7|nr:PREDICTED: uncharacterized protein LOC107329706 isoform X4 [Acropora digitifera]
MGNWGSSIQGLPCLSSQEATEGCAGLVSSRKLKVTLLGSEWGSTKGGLSTINRELAIQLAKNGNVEVSMYLPWYSEEDKRTAAEFKVCLLKAKKKPGYEPIDWLAMIPRHHHMDVVIGHGIHLGRQVPHIRELHPDCKWIQVVHTDPEELGMFKDYADPTVKGAKKQQAEIELCKLADKVVAVGPNLSEAFARYLRSCGKDEDVINLTPGIFSEFANINQAAKGGETFCVLVFGCGDSEDFRLKGYDIAARAVAKLEDEEHSFKLVFVGAPNGEQEKVKERFLKEGISPSQLIVRSAKDRERLAEEFCQADLVIMPSRTEGFGLAALEALSAGLPVLVIGNSGIGKALKRVPCGSNCVINNEDPVRWAEAIKAVCRKERKVRLEEAILLRQKYAETYQWEGQCSTLVEKMLQMIKGVDQVAPVLTINSLSPATPSPVLDNKPPRLSVKMKKARDVVASTTEWRDVHLPIDILLLTVESCDFLSCYSLLGQPFRSYNKELGYVYFGRMGEASDEGKLWVALMTSSAGADTPGGSLSVAQIAFKVLRPKAVFSVGTCISLDPEKVRMGDVIISSNLTTAEGFKVPVSTRFGRLAKDAPFGWLPPLENPGELEVNVHPNGDILSLSLTEERQYDDICKEYPAAVAIETEGKGVYAAAHTTNIEWVIVKGVASYFYQNHSATSDWKPFASTMAASVVAKLLMNPTVFREWRHYNQENPAAPHQAVAANNLGNQASSAIPERGQQHPFDAVVTSGNENERQGARHGASGDQQDSLREYGESFVKLFIWTKSLEREKKEAMEEILTPVVKQYVKCKEFSKDNLKEDLKSFTEHIENVYGVNLVTVGKGSVIIILDCPTLDSLELLWNDYRAGLLDKLAERYLVTNEMKKKFDLETVSLKTTILEEDYLNCKEALMELRSKYSGEFKLNVWEVKLCTCRC